MQNHVFVSKHPVVTLQNHVFNPKGTFATYETLFHFQNTILHPCKTLFQFQNPFSQTATTVFKIDWISLNPIPAKIRNLIQLHHTLPKILYSFHQFLSEHHYDNRYRRGLRLPILLWLFYKTYS